MVVNMDDFSSYIILIVIVSVILIALLFSAIDIYRKDLMAKGRVMFMIAMLLFIVGIITFYVIYVLGPAAFSSGGK
jgi:membrane-anchored protein YejM (alkaline phosphatase superfamily)